MASMLRRAMVYLGLVDDEYDEYEGYDDTQVGQPGHARPSPEPLPEPVTPSTIRPLSPATLPTEQPSGVTPLPRPSAVVRPFTPVQNAKPQVIAPAGFGAAQEIGDRLKANQPVIVNLQDVDRDLSRRIIDFCSGATYALGGVMERVADKVFMLTPSNVEVSAEERKRLQERGLYRS